MWFEDYISYSMSTPFDIRFIIRFLCISGMRASEIFLVSKQSLLYIEGSFTYVQPKTKIVRTIKFPDWFLQDIRDYRRFYGNFKTHFQNYKNLKSCCKTFITFPFRPDKGLTYFHNCRYLYVLGLLMSGSSELQISQKLGHNELSTVKIYINRAREIYNKKHNLGGQNG